MQNLRWFKRMIICLILALVLGLALSGNAFAQGQPTATAQPTLSTRIPAPTSLKNSIEGSWKIQLSQKQYQDPVNQRQQTEFRLLADLRYEPLENIYFLLGPKFTYTNGYVQTQESQSASKSELGVREASINLSLAHFTAAAGALDQTKMHPGLLLEDQTFPALSVMAHSDLQANWVFIGGLERAIPTTSSLSTQTRDAEKTPGFSSAFLSLRAQKMRIDLDLRMGAYGFENLPLSVSNKSILLGNTPQASTTAGTDAKFNSEFNGPFASLYSRARLTRRIAIGGQFEWIQNDQAPATLNQGLRAKGFTDLGVSRDFEISPFYEYFRIEPDATVALYNSDLLGTNRVGYRTGLSLTYKRTLKVSVSGGERDAVFVSPFQQREKTLNLRLETLDVAI